MAKHLLAPGHTACPGCGQAIAARLVVDAAGPNTIIANATGCLEVFTSCYPWSAWEVPWIHSLFENTAAVAAGIDAALKYLGKKGINVIAQAGDGGTADIGLQALSGMMERGHNVLFVCYDNGAYMNTGIQRSSLTPYDASTTTSPVGKRSFGNPTRTKNLFEIAVAHRVVYAATASVGYPQDLQRKVKKALSYEGPKFIHVFTPCPLGWRHEPRLTYEIGRLAVETCLFPLLEYENGEIKARKVPKPKPVEEFLKLQGRFRHLFSMPGGEEEIAKIQMLANENIDRYGLSSTKIEPKSKPSEG